MAIFLSAVVCVFFAISSVFADNQQPLTSPFLVGEELDLIYEYSSPLRHLSIQRLRIV